ncbi:hypothetical protein [Dinghuibacter silviterrae]|uniref:Uncharacterized protein n=1 Tax=Dinghuibacter silviterrae TaxID=1539049 RepID=A0A4R8DQS2_9BACT|nr:hypothetical protein [Dinghuibacter silviterrae]TDX00502.1 hypothetical protein EDB95_1527 [Dinghuibacter silviterrae]
MGRKLPVVEVAGICFYIDVMREELRQVDNSKNTISFNFFRQEGDGYVFLYDVGARRARQRNEEFDGAVVCWAMLPALMELDPQGLADKYDIPIEELCPDKSFYPPQRVTARLIPFETEI